MTLAPSTISSSVHLPAPATRAMDLFVARFTNRLETPPNGFRRQRLPRSAAPDAEQRAWLEGRRDDVRAAMTPTPGPEVNRALLKLMGAHAAFGAPEREMLGKVAIYAEAVAHLPTWAIDAARKAFLRPGWRSMWSGHGCPEAADLVAECRFILLPFETELTKIEAVLDAEIYTDGATEDERREVLAHFGDVLAEMRAGGAAITEPTEEEISAERTAMARANECFRARDRAQAAAAGRDKLMWGRLPISDELARKIGLRAPAEVE
ncbi:hypothetical protein [Methylobacterium sp. WL6]|uniref:hypothetical protein n=1 Tax=Methylobacterium sp. WL6 TaxID=2603901 RepID=UPI0011C95FC5|nr:hypothetical protein [Methylobacterium sp. WL6]TXN60552.1 hypothetical protein FV230_25830 [Methylobacterium sp. WL6]